MRADYLDTEISYQALKCTSCLAVTRSFFPMSLVWNGNCFSYAYHLMVGNSFTRFTAQKAMIASWERPSWRTETPGAWLIVRKGSMKCRYRRE